MTTYLGKSCSFGLPRVPFVNCRRFMYLVISLLVYRAGCGIVSVPDLFIFLLSKKKNKNKKKNKKKKRTCDESQCKHNRAEVNICIYPRGGLTQ